MSPRIRKATAIVCSAARSGGAVMGVALAAAGAGGARPPHPGPMSSATLAKIASTLGVSTAQLQAALDANRPAKPAGGARGPDGMATELAAALGADVTKVRAILAANRPPRPARSAATAGRPPRGARPSNARLVAALASGLDLDSATVKAAFAKLDAAHEAEHSAREAAMYAAIASDLGLSTDAVQAAFEANRPAMPAR